MNAKLQTIAQEQSGATKTNSQLTVANTKNPYQKITVDTCFPTKCAVVTQFHIFPNFFRAYIVHKWNKVFIGKTRHMAQSPR